MAGKTLDVQYLDRDSVAVDIANKWVNWNSQRAEWLEEKRELRNYIFATDTSTTSNNKNGWKNSTTVPKLCQIRDNLHANYVVAAMPNDNWLNWEAHSLDSATKKKKEAIEAYMGNKLRESDFRNTVSQLLYDYIDSGNCFVDAEYVNETKVDPVTGEEIPGYIGPKAKRISYMDIVFNPLATDFATSPVITRTLKDIGELKLELENNPEMRYNEEIIAKAIDFRVRAQALSVDDLTKLVGMNNDGFGNLQEYFGSGTMEILEFRGHIYDKEGNFKKDRIITVVDRSWVARDIESPSWFGGHGIAKGGWRYRPDNLWSMGPLDNLVGMQYRIDHLENAKADATDMISFPVIGVRGNVEEFEWKPGTVVNLGDDGAVDVIRVDSAILNADFQIQQLENKMEEMAGAPRSAMGIRTPGEKTAFEVQSLQNASSRIFQEKITDFEINVLEPLVNKMLELAKRNLDGADIARVIDDDVGVQDFISVTKEDLTAAGKLRPVGARHFAAQAQMVQNYIGMRNIFAADSSVMAHVSGKQEAKMFEELLGLAKFNLVKENIRIAEQQETAKIIQQMQQEFQEAQQPPQDLDQGV